jgi:AraC-like DNA-binding protein
MENELMNNLEHHYDDCPYYMKDSDPVFEIINHSRDVEVSQKMRSSALVVVREGSIEFQWECKEVRVAVSGEMFLLPANVGFSVKFLEYSSLLYLFVPVETDICWHVKQILAGYSVKSEEKGSVLQILALIQKQIDFFIEATKVKQLCTKFLHLQISSIIYNICMFYSEDLLADFFLPIRYSATRQSASFHEIVLRNKNRLFSVTEFAAELFMSRTTFRRHFERVFEMHPQEWIKQERMKLIEHELKYDTKTLGEIAKMTGFNNSREFYFYCKKYFGKTAMEIRKGI